MKGRENSPADERTGALPEVCKTLFDLENLKLRPGCYYDSLPLCVIDAVCSVYRHTEDGKKRS